MMKKEERRRFLLSPKMLNAINLGTWDSIVLFSKEEWKIWKEEFQRFNIPLSMLAEFQHWKSLWFCSIGVSIGLLPSGPVSDSKSRVYFLWHRKIPCFDLVTSIPKKYLRFPSCFISNSDARYYCKLEISSWSFPITIMSSTYIIKAVIFPFPLFKNKVWSELLAL